MPAHKIVWVDGTTIELESSTPTGTGLCLVLKDGRSFNLDLDESIGVDKGWKTSKLVRVTKLKEFELDENVNSVVPPLMAFADFESTQSRQLIVGVKALRESHLQQNELPNLIFDTLNEQGEKIDQTLKLQRESKEQFEPLKDHLHAVFALFRQQVRKQAASKGGAAHGVKKKIEILANELAGVGPPELMKNKRQKLRSIPDPVFFKYLLGLVHGEDWADEFFAGEIKSGAVSGETLRRWSRTLEGHPLVAQFIIELEAGFVKSPKEYEDSINNEDLNEGFRTTSNP